MIHILLANDDKVSGQLEKMLMEIPYASLPGDMIDTLTIDMDGITTGTVLMVKDIPELMSEEKQGQTNLQNSSVPAFSYHDLPFASACSIRALSAFVCSGDVTAPTIGCPTMFPF